MMYENRHSHYRKPYRNSLGGLAVGLFLIALAVAIFLGNVTWNIFLPVLFVGLAFASLLGGLSSYHHTTAYGGLQGFVWLLGLALCFAIGFWPWILLPIGVSMILGALAAPVMGGLSRGLPPTYTTYQPGQPYEPAPPYQPFQQGYQPPQQTAEAPQQDEQQREYTQQP
jgi:hypothetical protein